MKTIYCKKEKIQTENRRGNKTDKNQKLSIKYYC